jgi:hypothetical protein
MLDLSDGKGRPARWTILIGENGTGKTTILQSLASCEPERPPRRQGGNAPERDYPDPRLTLTYLPDLWRGDGKVPNIRVRIASGPPLSPAGVNYRAGDLTFSIRDPRGSTSWKEPTTGWNVLRCYGYGASRRLSSALLSEPTQDDPIGSLFSDDFHLRNAEEWLLQLDYSASKPSKVREEQTRRLKLVKGMLVELLPDVDDIRFSEPTPERRTPRAEFRTRYGWVGLRGLGHGYRTLIAWVVDLASRLFDRDPESPNPLAQPGVVLVDEIDLHMHPVWQRKVMSYLSQCFPNAQFVATAHSPLIVQAAGEDANIALLRPEGDHVVIDNDVEHIRGWRIDQLLTSDLFGLPSARPPEFDDLFRQRKELLEKPKLTKEDERRLAELEEKIGPLPVAETAEAVKLMSDVRETLRTMKEARGKPR